MTASASCRRSAVYESDEVLIAWLKEIQNILTQQDPPVINYGEMKWYTVLRNDIHGFTPNPLYLNAYNVGDMYREQSAWSIVEKRRHWPTRGRL